MIEGQRLARGLADEFRQASDAKLLKITGMIDQLPERGQADALLDPIRDRLAALRPARHLTRTRLLFMPFDAVLVPPARWRPDHSTLPRSVLTPVLELLAWNRDHCREAMPDAERGGAALLRVATPIWQDAGVRLTATEYPAAWRDPAWQQRNGLTPEMIRPMVGAMALVLLNAAVIHALPDKPTPEVAERLGTLLSAAASAGLAAWGLMLAVLLNGSMPDEVIRIAVTVIRGRSGDGELGNSLNRAIGAMLDRIEDFPIECGNVSDQIALIHRMEALGNLDGRPAEEYRRLHRLRTDLVRANRDLFGRMVDASLPDAAGPTAGPVPDVTDEALDALEAGMRRLRVFAVAASRLGDAAEYERLLENAARRCGMADDAGGLSAVERLRLVELLVGGARAVQTCAPC